MRNLGFAVAFCAFLACSPVEAKTFVGVLWPMFGPFPAIGLVELVAELKMMPDVEVHTYLHQSWPSLVDDIDRLPCGTRTLIIGYSLGANSSVFVANKAKYIDTIIALQPSMLSWTPSLTGRVGHVIEVYNPNPWMTFGGMGSKKLVGNNIEYIANNDSHPGAQFSSAFRDLAKDELAKLTTDDRLSIARTEANKSSQIADRSRPAALTSEQQLRIPRSIAVAMNANITGKHGDGASSMTPTPSEAPASQHLVAGIHAAETPAEKRPEGNVQNATAFLDELSGSVNAGDLSPGRGLTVAELHNYAARLYQRMPGEILAATSTD